MFRTNQKTHRVLSCNIRVALAEDEKEGVGWPQRKELCLSVIKKHQPDIICLQEVLRVQANDFRKAFPDFQLLGFDGPEMDAHPDDGYYGIAKNPILYNTIRYELINAGGYWLSETPAIAGSKSWGTARARHANWIRLKDKKSNAEFRVINLHLDLESNDSRVKQLEMVVEECAQYPIDFPQILSGDFNTSWNHRVFDSVRKENWKDSYVEANGSNETGFTRHDFLGEKYKPGGYDDDGKIDFIFSRGSIKSRSSEILKDHHDGFYPSDHYFLSADLEI